MSIWNFFLIRRSWEREIANISTWERKRELIDLYVWGLDLFRFLSRLDERFDPWAFPSLTYEHISLTSEEMPRWRAGEREKTLFVHSSAHHRSFRVAQQIHIHNDYNHIRNSGTIPSTDHTRDLSLTVNQHDISI